MGFFVPRIGIFNGTDVVKILFVAIMLHLTPRRSCGILAASDQGGEEWMNWATKEAAYFRGLNRSDK